MKGRNKMSYIEFDKTKPLDVIPIGRIAIDFNPTDMNMPLSQSSNFNKYVGGSPANIAVGLARLGAKCGFIARVSDDQFGDYVENYFKADGIEKPQQSFGKHGLGKTAVRVVQKHLQTGNRLGARVGRKKRPHRLRTQPTVAFNQGSNGQSHANLTPKNKTKPLRTTDCSQ